MSLATMVDLSFVIGVLVLLVTIMYRQRSAYRTYQRTQQQVLDRQAEMMTLYREALDNQKEAVRLLTVIASSDRR